MKTSRWVRFTFISIFVIGSLAIGVGTSPAAGTLAFQNNPGHAAVGVALTTANFTAGDAIKVLSSSGSSVTVALCLPASAGGTASATCPAPLGDPGFSLGGTTNRKPDRTGVATFGNLTVSQIGSFVLYASTSGGGSDTSNPFRIFNSAKSCQSGNKCQLDQPVGDLTTDLMNGQVSIAGTGVVAGAINLDPITDAEGPLCDDPTNTHAQYAFSFYASDPTAPVTVTITIAKAWDQLESSNGRTSRAVCFIKDSGGVVQDPVLLPNCSPTITIDCILSITKSGGGKKAPPGATSGDVVIKAIVIDGRCF